MADFTRSLAVHLVSLCLVIIAIIWLGLVKVSPVHVKHAEDCSKIMLSLCVPDEILSKTLPVQERGIVVIIRAIDSCKR